jgi:hypothetical protein
MIPIHPIIVSKAAPAPPPLPTAGGSYVLSKDGKRWDPETNPSPTALIEAPTDGTTDSESPDPGEG